MTLPIITKEDLNSFLYSPIVRNAIDKMNYDVLIRSLNKNKATVVTNEIGEEGFVAGNIPYKSYLPSMIILLEEERYTCSNHDLPLFALLFGIFSIFIGVIADVVVYQISGKHTFISLVVGMIEIIVSVAVTCHVVNERDKKISEKTYFGPDLLSNAIVMFKTINVMEHM